VSATAVREHDEAHAPFEQPLALRLHRSPGGPTAPRELTWVVVAVGTVPQHWEPYLHPATLSA